MDSILGFKVKDYNNDIICYISAKHASFNYCLSESQDTLFDYNNMSTCGLLLEWASSLALQTSKSTCLSIITYM